MLVATASLRELSQLTRQLGVSLYAGLGVVKSFKLASSHTKASLRRALNDVIAELKSGTTLTDALEEHSEVFPRLLIDMVRVGELTGNLPEVLKSLSVHYENQKRLKSDFISSIMFPLLQLGIAILVIAALIFILGIIGESSGMKIDVLGFGLVGTPGALTWLCGWLMGGIGLYLTYRLISVSLTGKRTLHQLAMSIPVVGYCMRSFAIARFSWAFALTQGGGMPIEESIETSLRSTSNGVFEAASSQMIASIMEGASLYEAMSESGLYPKTYLEFVHVAEESGTVAESLDRMSSHFEDDARRSLKALAGFFGWLIWAMVAAFIIFLIFKIAFWYIGLLSSF